jgi:serine/threonine protein kinase/Flp pilus assembly protein TadD
MCPDDFTQAAAAAKMADGTLCRDYSYVKGAGGFIPPGQARRLAPRTGMTGNHVLDPADDLDSFVAAFEAAQASAAAADLKAFLPAPDHPLYGDVLRELVRIDLEYGWARGCARNLQDYQRDFPQLFQEAADLQAITFEEFRLRRQAGEDPSPEEYRQRFGVDVRDWPPPRYLLEGPLPLSATVRGSDALAWFVHDIHRSDPQAARQLARALTGLPDVGTEFLGFHLIAELGRGAFGRVYLARQGELADRPVALKVSGDVLGESRTLAQLQHTNIVPIFSVHHASPFHAVCMPFLGSTTLEDILENLSQQATLPRSGRALVDTLTNRTRVAPGADGPPQSAASLETLCRLTYVQAVLRIGSRLADGLAHAHEHGILHRDLKPANVLLADDGQPILLDFNLSEDTKLRSGAAAAFVGGTLPYMAPEQLVAFQKRTPCADARTDLYALGVILYALLTGRHPFPIRAGLLDEALPRMIEDRLGPPPRLRSRNPDVSPAVESIVRRCLEPDPAHRYQTARQLHEDLERQLHDLPLRHAREPSLRERVGKWARRHPRLTSSTSVAVLAGLLLLALGGLFAVRQERLAKLEAAESFERFHDDMREAQILFLDAATGQARPEEIRTACRRALDRYGVLKDPDWQQATVVRHLPLEQQERLQDDVGEVLFLLAGLPDPRDEELRRAWELNGRAVFCYSGDKVPAALLRQRAALAGRLGQPTEAERLLAQAEATPLRTARDRCLLACVLTGQGRFRQALPLWQSASFQDPQNVWVWYGLGHCYERLARPAQAAACYSACIALNPSFHGWYFRRGLVQLQEGQDQLAEADFDQTIRLRPNHAEAHVNRGIARLNAGRCTEAIDDLTHALKLGAPPARVTLIRAQAREKAGDRTGAERDRAESLHHEPADEAGWVARGVARIASAPDEALRDFDQALRRNPRSLPALQNKAHFLSEKLGRTEEAVQVLDELTKLYPEEASGRAARGVLLARLGKREAALRDAAEAQTGEVPRLLYQVAGIYALTSRSHKEDRERAFPLLAGALRGGFGYDLIATDHDLDPIRDDPQFQRLLEAAHMLRQGLPPPSERE